MIPFVPEGKDRLGARVIRGSVRWAVSDAVTLIPNDETIAIFNWLYFSAREVLENARYIGLRYYNADPEELCLIGTGTDQLKWRFYNTADQPLYTDYVAGADALYVQVVDRDNVRAQAWIDGVLNADEALIQDPNFSSSNMGRIGDGVSAPCNYRMWRGLAVSLKNGETPTEDEWSELMRCMRNPDAPLDPDLVARIGSFYSEYRPGEGPYGSATVVDIGTNLDDLAWQGGETVEDLRVRCRAPVRRTKKTFYTLIPGSTATTGATAFGFAPQPVVLRVMLGDMTFLEGGAYTIAMLNLAGTDYIYVRRTGTRLVQLLVRANNVLRTLGELVGDQLSGGDLYVVVNGTDIRGHFGGQCVFQDTHTETLDISGSPVVSLDGRSQSCRVAAWNPPTVPGTLEAEIRQCCMNPEMDPRSLELYRKVNFSLDSDHLVNPGDTDVVNDWGPGTLVLSAGRDIACAEMIRGTSP